MGVSIGVVGVGMFGASFVSMFRNHPLTERIALCDTNAARLKEVAGRFGISETYPSLNEICKTDLDALAIITQPWLHAPQVIQAMESGKHAYSAVPMIMLPSGDEMLDWCARIIRTSEKTGKHYMMGETSYYRPAAMYCRRRASAGDFGDFVLAEGAYHHDIDEPTCSLRDVAKNRWGDQWGPSKRGGVPMHYPTHSMGGFLSVMPGVHMTKASAIGQVISDDDWFSPETIYKNPFGNETGFFKLSNGAVARICEYRRIGFHTWEGFSLYGSKGCFHQGCDDDSMCYWVTVDCSTPLSFGEMRDPLPAEIDAAFRKDIALDMDIYAGQEDEHPYLGGHGGSHAYLVHEFMDAVANDRVPAINAWVSARFFAPGIIAHKSAMKDGEWLDIPDWGDPPA